MASLTTRQPSCPGVGQQRLQTPRAILSVCPRVLRLLPSRLGISHPYRAEAQDGEPPRNIRPITRLNIQELILHGLTLDKAYRIEPPLSPSSLPLRRLFLNDVHVEIERGADGGAGIVTDTGIDPISIFFATLLSGCAPTLESLDCLHGLYQQHVVSLGDEPPSFPCLRRLVLRYLKLSLPSMIALLKAPLRHLVVPDCAGVDEALSKCSPLPSLETLVIPSLTLSRWRADERSKFLVVLLEDHKQIRKFCVEQAASETLDTLIVPIISAGSFPNLRSLSLSWSGPGTAEETRPHIATISISHSPLSGQSNHWSIYISVPARMADGATSGLWTTTSYVGT